MFAPRWSVTLVALLMVLIGELGGQPDLAHAQGKGGGIPPAPGTIYFYRQLTSYAQAMSMKGDGTGKQNTMSGEPSAMRHAGSRWFLIGGYGEGVDFFGNPAFEIYAIDELGNDIQLTADPNVIWSMETPAWSKNDGFVSFTGLVNTPEGITGGLFVIDVDWTLGFPQAGPPVMVMEDPQAAVTWNVNLYAHDWSPDGTQLVFEAQEGAVTSLYTASFSELGVTTRFLTTGFAPEWSPDGARIAFARNEIWTIKPDGTNSVKLTTYSKGSSSETGQSQPSWSPDGAYLAYTQSVTKGSKTTYSVQRIPSTGGSSINLTSDIGSGRNPRWRP